MTNRLPVPAVLIIDENKIIVPVVVITHVEAEIDYGVYDHAIRRGSRNCSCIQVKLRLKGIRNINCLQEREVEPIMQRGKKEGKTP
jgi:hypothetical protein